MDIRYRLLLLTRDNRAQQVEISAGASWKPLPSTIAYEGTIPLTYRTNWLKSELQAAPRTTCRKDSSIFTLSCRTTQLTEEIGESLDMEIQALVNSWDPVYLRKQKKNKRAISLSFVADGLNYCCGVATQEKLDSLVMSSAALDRRISTINEGLEETISTISSQSMKMEEANKATSAALKMTESKIKHLQEYTEKLGNTLAAQEMSQGKIVEMTANNNINIATKFIKLTRALKEHGIIQSCRHHHIPIAIVTPEILRTDLEHLNRQLERNNQELALTGEDLSKYYELPICECSFSEDKVTIHIKIPIRQKNHEWKLFELITNPFAWGQQTCIIQHNTLYLAIAERKYQQEDIRQITGTGLHLCKPYENKLCYLPRFSADNLQGPACATKLFHGATVQDLTAHCPMHCHQSTLMTISEINEEEYVVTHPPQGAAIHCGTNHTSIRDDMLNKPGALRLILPCECTLQHFQEIIIPRRYPCPENLKNSKMFITHILPAAWTNLKTFGLNPIHQLRLPTFDNLSECLNKNWSLTVPHLNLTSNKNTFDNILNKLTRNEKEQEINTWHTEKHNAMLIWNVILSIGVAYLLFHHHHAIIPTLIPTSHAQDLKAQATHDATFYITCTALSMFITYLIGKGIHQWITSRNTRAHLPEVAADTSQSTHLILEIPRTQTTFSADDAITCVLRQPKEHESTRIESYSCDENEPQTRLPL